MEVRTEQASTGSSSAGYPRPVMLEKYCKIMFEDPPCSTSDAGRTLAAARTTTGHLIHVFLSLEEPPALSCICLHLPGNIDGGDSVVTAAHGDSVLISVSIREGCLDLMTDHFIYNVGAAAMDPPRPPSLSLLDHYYVAKEKLAGVMRQDWLSSSTGIMHHGEDELLVADLWINSIEDRPRPVVAELLLFRSDEWSVKHPRIRRGNREVGELPSWWNIVKVVPVGDRLCWVDLIHGVLLCDVFVENPKLQYLALPVDHKYDPATNRNVCATAGGGALKFVNIFARCCCGDMGAIECQRSQHAYTINTWTLRMCDMEWVKDGMVDATELWALDAYKGLPRKPLDHPVVSMDEPYVVYLILSKGDVVGYGRYRQQTIWLLMVDTRSKTIQSVSRYPRRRLESYPRGCLEIPVDLLVPSNVSYYLNSYSYGTLTGQCQVDIERKPVVIVDELLRDEDARNSVLQSCCEMSVEPAMQAYEIFEAFEEKYLAMAWIVMIC